MRPLLAVSYLGLSHLATARENLALGVNVIVVAVRERKVTSGPNRDFNMAVRFCDVDLNGIITEAEAEAFWTYGVPMHTPTPVPSVSPVSK